MNDTQPKMAKLYHQLLMAKTGEERLLMGCSMFDFAKLIVLSSIKNENPGISPSEIRQELFKRFYQNDFTASQTQKILAMLDK
jgi:hypothetical protein